MDKLTSNLVQIFNTWPPETLWLIELVLCFGAILFLHRYFGAAGLYVYIAVAVIGCNVQVLKAVQFSIYPEPVALGTILYSSTYLATDILVECFGKKAAQVGVWLGFAAQLLFSILILVTLGFKPLAPEQTTEGMEWASANHQHIAAIFSPQLSLFVAGMSAYLISQLNDAWVFHWLKVKTEGRFLWLRNNASTFLSALIDNTVFSILAWIVFNSNPLPLKTVVMTYILGTYWLRVLVAVLETPVIYIARYWWNNAKSAVKTA